MTADLDPQAVTRILGGLLRGDSRMFGERVVLSWPDGLPPGYTDEDLRSLGARWCADPSALVLADAPRCMRDVVCGEVLEDGRCPAHGTAVSVDSARRENARAASRSDASSWS